MASKSTKKLLTSGDRVIAVDLRPKDLDTQYWGNEPIFVTQPDSDRRGLALVIAFNWYNRFFGVKESKEFLANYALAIGMDDVAKKMPSVEDREVMISLGWLARLYLRGLNLTDHEKQILISDLNRLIESISKPINISSVKTEQKSEVVNNRPNIQDIMKERTRLAAGEIEGWFDEFLENGVKSNDVNVNCIGILTERNIMAQHMSILTDIWKTRIDEFKNVLAGEDRQLIEAYSKYNKTQLKTIIKYCETVLAELNSYVSVKKASKSPRKKKAASPEKQSSKMKYLKLDETLKLTSVSPAKIIGASEVYLYDVEKRKLTYLIADDHIGTLSIKGTTIIGFDSTKSQTKTVRKPQDIIKKLMTAGKPASRKVFSELTTVSTIFSGRTNDNIIILKAY